MATDQLEEADDAAFAVLYSGGLDSAILLAVLLARGHRVWPLAVDCRWFWQAEELRAARQFLDAVRQPVLEELVLLDMPLADVYGRHWSMTGEGVPGADQPDEQVYLPGHNPLLLIKAHLWCHLHGVGQLALGSLSGNPFADATGDFFHEFESSLNHAVAGHVRLLRPFAQLNKSQVMDLGRELPLELTFSCFAPVGGLHCGACNKCAERRRAFAQTGLPDKTRYAAERKVAS